MKLLPAAFLALAYCACSPIGFSAPSDTPTVFTPVVSKLVSPAGADSSGAALANGPDHTLYLSWTEPTAQGRAMKFSRLDRAAKQWSTARTIVEGADLEKSSANIPQLVIQPSGRITAVWSVNNPTAPVPLRARRPRMTTATMRRTCTTTTRATRCTASRSMAAPLGARRSR
jgi:hypothetical protein